MQGDTTHRAVVRLRQALRSGDQRAIDYAALPLIDRLAGPLLEFSNRLVRSSHRPLGVEGADIAQEAWSRGLHLLLSAEGEAIQTEDHFVRLLYRIARNWFLDRLAQAQARNDRELDCGIRTVVCEGTETWGSQRERLMAGDPELGYGLFWLQQGPLTELVMALFGDEALFRARWNPRRRVRHYQAYIAFCLVQQLQLELEGAVAEGAVRLLYQRYVTLLGMDHAAWDTLQQVATPEGRTEAALLAAVNAQWGTALQNKTGLSVLRYELNQLARQPDDRERQGRECRLPTRS